MAFHSRCGNRILLSNANRTARRNISYFNNGLVFSADPLPDDILFEVRIDEKIESWTGNIELGVTCINPGTAEDLPSVARDLENGTWIMANVNVMKDGVLLKELYIDVDKLVEGDRVGVVRTAQGELVFYINGEPQGVAAANIPTPVWVVVNLYGKCTQVSITNPKPTNSVGFRFGNLSQATEITQNIEFPISVDVSVAQPSSTLSNNNGLSYSECDSFGHNNLMATCPCTVDSSEPLHFHSRTGTLIILSGNNRTAERRRPLDEFNNGVAMTHRPLKDNELFEIRIDKLVDKWSGSIELGVTTHNPAVLHFPATMTNLRTGTIMMSGCGILTNGKGTVREYGEFNLDELREGDRVGLMRTSNKILHYFINGQDQGEAAMMVASTLWGVIDLYGMAIKVTIVDRDERDQLNMIPRRNNILPLRRCTGDNPAFSPDPDQSQHEERLTFHSMCGTSASVTQNGRTALRPNATDDFNNGVVLTKRPLRMNEFFQVRLENLVSKWAGSIEIGVTTHSPTELEYPVTMTNVRTGTWMMTGTNVMHNGVTVIEQYGHSLDRLQIGDRVGVVRKNTGVLHFLVNGVDQGPAGSNVPERVYGVIDLYGQATQVSIVDESIYTVISPDAGNSSFSNTTLNGGMYNDQRLRFHSCHGPNARISNSGLTASRPKALAEFNGSIVFSSRPLRQRELFECVLEVMIDHWNGSIEIGVTGIRPEEVSFANTATDFEHDMVMMSGQTLIHNGVTVRNDMPFNLDHLTNGSRVGVLRNGDNIHFFVNGMDTGPAYECPMVNMYAVVDLYGQCAQVRITTSQSEIRAPYATSENSQSLQATSVIHPILETKHRWSCISGKLSLSQNWTGANRCTMASAAMTRGLVFSEHHLVIGEPFEIKITEFNESLAGCLRIGVTDINLSDDYIRKHLPNTIGNLPANVWYICNNEIRHNNTIVQYSTCSLEWLRVGDRITLELTSLRTLRVLLNSEDMDIYFSDVKTDVHAVVELVGSTMGVQIISSQGPTSPLRPCSLRLQDSLDLGIDPLKNHDSMLESIESESINYEFSDYHGKNVQIIDERRGACRSKSYNHGIVIVSRPLCRGQCISVKISEINPKWSGTIILGAIGSYPNNPHFPTSAILLRRPCWIVTHDLININGSRVPSKAAECLMSIQKDTVITITLSHTGSLSLQVGEKFANDIVSGIPNLVYPLFDLYGKCSRLTILNNDVRCNSPINDEVPIVPSRNSSMAFESERNVPQCEKGNLEVHEKEIELLAFICDGMARSAGESVSENLLRNISIKNSTLDHRCEPSITCSLQDSLQRQHSTNLNIQRSQSAQRFGTIMSTSAENILSPPDINPCMERDSLNVDVLQFNDNNYFTNWETNEAGEPEQIFSTEQSMSNSQKSVIKSSVDKDENNKLDQAMCSTSNLNENSIQPIINITDRLADVQLNGFTSPLDCLTHTDFDSIPSVEKKDCKYLKLVLGFKQTLVLPDVFFACDIPICYCSHCMSSTSSSILKGWVRFKLNQQVLHANKSSTAMNYVNDWTSAFYLSRVDKIRAILDHGQPLPIETRQTSIESFKDDSGPGTRLALYSSLNTRDIPQSAFRHCVDKIEYKIQTAFEVRVQTQALCAADQRSSALLECIPSTSGDTEIYLPGPDEGMPKWTTKEAGACVLTAVLLKLCPVSSD